MIRGMARSARRVGFVVLMAAVAAAGLEFDVASSGADTNAGTAAAPFATLARARDAIRQVRAGGGPPQPVTVTVRGGIYCLPETLVLGAEDSGTAAAPVVYRARAGEEVILTGGRVITGWQPYRGAIMQADVGAQGFRGIAFQQLLCNGRRQTLARTPNADPENPVAGGWAYVDGAPVPLYKDIAGESLRTLQCKPDDMREWAHPKDGEVFVFPRYNWWNDILRIAAIDRATRLITLVADASYAIRPGDRYYLRNLFEELDAPGEWYLDRRTWILYFWPAPSPAGGPPVDLTGATVTAPVLETLIQMSGVEHVTWRGFTLECAERSALVLQSCRNCLVAGNTIRNIGGRCEAGSAAVSLRGGSGNGAVGNDISDVGSHAIALDGGDFATLVPAGNYADNNYIHHPGVFYKQGVGVSVGGVGNRVSHNLIHDCPRFGIVWGGCDHVFEFNHIRHCTLETADTGAIYSWQVDWSKRGTEIRYNYLHDIIGFGQENGKWVSPHMNWGIYLDDGTCGTRVYGNLVARTILGGVHYHGGRDNVVENNILIDGRDSQVQYSGYVKGGHPVPMMTETWGKFSGTPAYEKYAGYAELKRSLEDAWQMAGNKFLRNIVCYANPAAKLFVHYSLPFDKTQSDYNLIWHFGKPLRTGCSGIKGVSGPNLVANPGFETGEPGALPAEWEWQVRPNDSSAALDAGVCFAGKQSVRLEGRGTTTDSSGQTLCPNFVSAEMAVIPGRTYRLTARVRAAAAGTAFGMLPQSYIPNVYWWGQGMSGTAGTEWQEVEVVFTFPAPGDPGWHAVMKAVRVRLDVRQELGTIWVDEVALHEATPVDEWEAWQAAGLDRHSVVADPQFVDAAHDDFRLKPESPALALGFTPIPLEKIGPYQDELRATWPIVEARGAREQMKIDWGR
jgi:hypothetical protein